METISWMACFRGEIISRMACSKEGNLAFLWERIIWMMEIVRFTACLPSAQLFFLTIMKMGGKEKGLIMVEGFWSWSCCWGSICL